MGLISKWQGSIASPLKVRDCVLQGIKIVLDSRGNRILDEIGPHEDYRKLVH
jgi:hypothetical protein